MKTIEQQLIMFFEITQKYNEVNSTVVFDENIAALITKRPIIFSKMSIEILTLSIEAFEIESNSQTTEDFGSFLGLIDSLNPWDATIIRDIKDDDLQFFLNCLDYVKHEKSCDFIKLMSIGKERLMPQNNYF